MKFIERVTVFRRKGSNFVRFPPQKNGDFSLISPLERILRNMVILPATEADLQAVIELVAQGRGIAPSGRRPVAGRLSLAGDGPARPLRGDGRIVHRRAAAPYAAFVFDGEPAYDRIEEGGWAAEGPYGGAPAGRGRALRAAGSCRRVAARSRPRGARARHPLVPHRHASRQRAHACAAREGGVRPVGARCATKPCGWLTRSRSSADPLRYVTASGDGMPEYSCG